ncbi:MAG: hypothetical protein RL750_1076 [Bacteroidota bacterium]|jgi:hypothetical protein
MPDRQTIQKELLEQNSCLAEQPSHMPYAVPEGYFECLAETILTRIRQAEVQEELGSLSPLLQQLSRTNPYNAPAGYFEQAASIPAKPATPVRSLFQKTWVRYAVAAAAVVTGIFIWLGQINQPTESITAQGVITKYKLEIQQLDTNKQIQLQEFIAAGLSGEETAQLEKSKLSGNGLLADVSEQELSEFVEQSEFITATEMND